MSATWMGLMRSSSGAARALRSLAAGARHHSPGWSVPGWLAMDTWGTERSSGREQGILIAGDRETTMEPFLLLDTIPAAAAPEDPAILRRMIAVAILRMTRLGQMPGVVATRTHIPALCHALRNWAAASRRLCSTLNPATKHHSSDNRGPGAPRGARGQGTTALRCDRRNADDWRKPAQTA